MRSGWLWISIALMATSFFAFLTMLSWYEVSFVVPVTSLAYVAGAFGAKLFLGEQLNATRWAGIALICAGVAMAWFDTVPAPLVRLGVAGALRWAVYALAIAPLAFYAIAIFAAWRFFRVAHHAPAAAARFRAARQHSEARPRAAGWRLREFRQFLPAGLSRIRNSLCRA